jgi:hypothetical protein
MSSYEISILLKSSREKEGFSISIPLGSDNLSLDLVFFFFTKCIDDG